MEGGKCRHLVSLCYFDVGKVPINIVMLVDPFVDIKGRCIDTFWVYDY